MFNVCLLLHLYHRSFIVDKSLSCWSSLFALSLWYFKIVVFCFLYWWWLIYHYCATDFLFYFNWWCCMPLIVSDPIWFDTGLHYFLIYVAVDNILSCMHHRIDSFFTCSLVPVVVLSGATACSWYFPLMFLAPYTSQRFCFSCDDYNWCCTSRLFCFALLLMYNILILLYFGFFVDAVPRSK